MLLPVNLRNKTMLVAYTVIKLFKSQQQFSKSNDKWRVNINSHLVMVFSSNLETKNGDQMTNKHNSFKRFSGVTG